MASPWFLLAVATIFIIITGAAAVNQEGHYLLSAKSILDDPEGLLSGWDATAATACNWTGITCSSAGAVTAVDLPFMSLSGHFPAILCLLPSLSRIDLSFNFINSTLPSSSLLPCSSLSFLDLSQNFLSGDLPISLPSSLTHLDLAANNFSGDIPPGYGSFPELRVLSLTANLLGGGSKIPAFLGNISTLRQLNLSYNPFAAGEIPAELGNLTSLEILWLAGCNLVGKIPSSIGTLTSLIDLDLSGNAISGEIPASIGGLAAAVQIELYNNSISGEIPSGVFSNMTHLRRLDASMNSLSGEIPGDVFAAPELESLHLYQNNLSGNVPAAAGGCRSLVAFRVFSNKLSGELPAGFGTNSPLAVVDLSDNQFSGEIPRGICGGGALSELLVIDNLFAGNIPEGLGSCSTLTRVRFANNRLSGEVPAGLWGLPHVTLLELTGNSLSGEISPAISGAGNLSKLLISGNGFTGIIPPEIGSARKLYQISAADNLLSGPLPTTLGELSQLGQLDLHNNSISGEMIGGVKLATAWTKLIELNLAGNEISGEIPPELGDLPVLNYLDLSSNRLSGEIPPELQNLKLNEFNLSSNQLSGEIPPLFRGDAYRRSFLGNKGLCVADLGCGDGDGGRSRGGGRRLVWVFFSVAGVVIAAGLAWFWWRYRAHKKSSKLGSGDGGVAAPWTMTSFHKLGFADHEILDCLVDEDNVIGIGASGKVYKAVLSGGETVAVKKLWGSKKVGGGGSAAGDDAFEAEVATLGKIRHKNIVKLWCSVTHKDCKLLVYEYMPNGSLGDLLHSGGGKGGAGQILDWPARYKIAVDAADGLSYLHHGCVPPIVHRDVKSNNILLDAELGAKVADFGVAKAVEAANGAAPKSMSVIAGSCGYIAPEYAYTLRVNEKSDIYSFGVVILELVTGKPPLDPEMTIGEVDLARWVCSTLGRKGLEHVVDTKLDLLRHREEIRKVLGIGILCTSSLPINRPSMRRVVQMLLNVRADPAVTKREEDDGRLSPYYYEESSGEGSHLG